MPSKTNSWVLFGVLAVLLMSVALCTFMVLFDCGTEISGGRIDVEENNSASHSTDDSNKPDKINFQPLVDDWVKSTGGEKSIMIYDLDRDEIIGTYDERKNYATASLYKLFVVYEGYRFIESGEWKADEAAGATGYTIEECLDLSIRESNSVCAETIWGTMGERYLDDIVVNNYRLSNTTVSDYESTAEDITMMMKKYFSRMAANDDDLTARMKDSFLNQPVTEYDWRQGLPSGFSNKVKVYNKVGWEYDEGADCWNLYHDTAIINFSDHDRHFIVTVLTSGVPYQSIRKFGTLIEESFRKND